MNSFNQDLIVVLTWVGSILFSMLLFFADWFQNTFFFWKSWPLNNTMENINDIKTMEVSILKLFFNIYSFLSERDRACVGGEDREGDKESKAGSRLWAVSTEPNTELELTDHKIMTWVEVKCLPTEPPRCPNLVFKMQPNKFE